jgi:hypothetical protein
MPILPILRKRAGARGGSAIRGGTGSAPLFVYGEQTHHGTYQGVEHWFARYGTGELEGLCAPGLLRQGRVTVLLLDFLGGGSCTFVSN